MKSSKTAEPSYFDLSIHSVYVCALFSYEYPIITREMMEKAIKRYIIELSLCEFPFYCKKLISYD